MRGHLRRRGKNRWAVVVYLGRDAEGKKRYKWHSVEGSRQKAEREQARLVHLHSFAGADLPKQTFSTYLGYWMESYAAIRVSRASQERYSRAIDLYIKPALGHIELNELRPHHLATYYADMVAHGGQRGQGLSKSTVRVHHNIIHNALERAVRWSMLRDNPAKRVDPPIADRFQAKTLTPLQLRRILDYTEGGRLYVPLYLLAYTGLRRSEVLGLQWRDIDWNRGLLVIARKWVKAAGGGRFEDVKGRRPHTVALTEDDLAKLRGRRTQQIADATDLRIPWNEEWTICAQEDGSPFSPNGLTNGFARVLHKVGLPHVRLHDLRHTHASLLLAENVSLAYVRDRLNHRDVQTTVNLYGHMVSGSQKEAAEKFRARMNRFANPENPAEQKPA